MISVEREKWPKKRPECAAPLVSESEPEAAHDGESDDDDDDDAIDYHDDENEAAPAPAQPSHRRGMCHCIVER